METTMENDMRVFCSECRYWLYNAYDDGMWKSAKGEEVEQSLCTFKPKTVVTPINEAVEFVLCADRNLRNDCGFFENVWLHRRRKRIERNAAETIKKAVFVARWKARFRALLFWRKK